MDSDAGSSAARRRRLVSTISGCFIPISLFFTAFLHSFIEGLGLLVFSAVKGCARRRRRYHTQALLLLFIICNTLSPFSTTIVSDLSMATRVRGAPRLSLWPDLKLHHYIQAFWPLVFTRHTSLRCSSALISTVNLSSDVCGVPPFSRRPDMEPQRSVSSHDDHSVSLQTRSASLFGSGLSSQKPLEAAHTDECSFSQSLLDFTDLRLSVEYVKSPWLHHGNDGVGFCCLNSAIALSESMVKPISLSDVNVKSSEVHISFFGAISGVHSKFPSEVHHQRPTPTSASIKLSLFLGWSLLKVEDCSPLVLFLSRKAIQTSSCQGHEKSLSIFLLFMGVKSSIKTPPFGRYFSFGFKAKDLCRIPYRLLPCVMVRLGPEGTTRLIQMRIEVMERSTSRYTVTISMVEDFEGRCNLFGPFEILSLSGSFMPDDIGGTRTRTGGMSVSLASPDGRVVGGGVAGLLVATSPVQVVVGSFLAAKDQKQEKNKQDFMLSSPTAAIPIASAADHRTNHSVTSLPVSNKTWQTSLASDLSKKPSDINVSST